MSLKDRGIKPDYTAPLNLADSPSPSIANAAQEPVNIRRGGETDVSRAISTNPVKTPIDPSSLKK